MKKVRLFLFTFVTFLITGVVLFGGGAASADSNTEMPASQSDTTTASSGSTNPNSINVNSSSTNTNTDVNTNSADTSGDSDDANDNSETITWDQLTPEQQAYFQSKGFTSSDTFFNTEVAVPESNSQDDQTNSETPANGFNWVEMTGSTKKIDSTMAHTEYILTSLKPIYSLDAHLSLGSHHFNSSVDVGGKLEYDGGIYTSYTGNKKYFSCKLSVQYVSSMGAGTVSCHVGGVTLGK